MVYQRTASVRADESNPLDNHIHQWQQKNPVTTETLVQLTLGAPQFMYNGGLLFAPIRYFDQIKRRSGLPEDVSALVHGVEEDSIDLELVNLNAWEERSALVQAGSFGESRFSSVEYGSRAPGGDTNVQERARVDSGLLEVRLPAASRIRLRLGLERRAGGSPSYRLPWDA